MTKEGTPPPTQPDQPIGFEQVATMVGDQLLFENMQRANALFPPDPLFPLDAELPEPIDLATERAKRETTPPKT